MKPVFQSVSGPTLRVSVKFLTLIFLLTTLHRVEAVTVTTSGRQVLVDGQTFTIKGVNYSPTPIGYKIGSSGTNCLGPYHWWLDRPSYIADFPQIKRLGANTIRTYDLMNFPDNTPQIMQALDEAQRNGLYVIMGYYVSHTEALSNGIFRTQTLNNFTTAVNTFKAHPAVLMWSFGNENNLDNGNTNADWYSLVQQAAQQAKAADPYHPVTTAEGECLMPDCVANFTFLNTIGNAAIGANDASLTFLDLWSVNIYRGASFGGVIEALSVSTMTTKPILITEFGKDAWRDSAAAEDGSMQANYVSAQWQEIQSHLSATASGVASLAGGVVFEWTDEWWKHSGDDCQTHSTARLFQRTNDTTDPNYQDEWFGITSVLPINTISNPNGTQRTFRSAYAALQAYWNPSGVVSAAAAAGNFFSETVRNYPNPFRVGTDPTRFVAHVNGPGTIDIRIYDASGQFVTGLPPITATAAGRYELSWDGRNRQGSVVSSGLYFARIEGRTASHEEKQFRRVVAVK